MKRLVFLSAVVVLLLLGSTGARCWAVILPPPPPIVLEPGIVGPEIGPDVYYDGPFVIGGVPYWYYGGWFFVLEGGFYRCHHMCSFNCGWYRDHWHHGWIHHRDHWRHEHGGYHGHEDHHEHHEHHEGHHGHDHHR